MWPRFFDQVSPSLRPLKTLKAGLTIGTPKRGWEWKLDFPGEVCKVILQRPERGEALWLAIHPRGWIKVTWCFRFVDVKNVRFFDSWRCVTLPGSCSGWNSSCGSLLKTYYFFPLCPTRVGHIGPFECVSAAFSLLPPVYPVWSYWPARSDIPTPVTIFFSCTAFFWLLCLLLGISRPPMAST